MSRNPISLSTAYGCPMNPFFIGQINLGVFWVFSAELSAPILVHVFHYSTIISKKTSLYILIPNIYLELGFEFEPQRIMDLTFVCPCQFPLHFLKNSSTLPQGFQSQYWCETKKALVPLWFVRYQAGGRGTCFLAFAPKPPFLTGSGNIIIIICGITTSCMLCSNSKRIYERGSHCLVVRH